MEFNIEKGIIPTRSRDLKNGIDKLLPLNQMVSGDSIFVPENFLATSVISNKLATYKKIQKLNFQYRNKNKTIYKAQEYGKYKKIVG